MNFQGTGKRLSSGDVGKAAKQIGIETAVLLAFLEVEAAGRGFDNQNRVKILPEAHIFYRNLKGALRSIAVSTGIAYAKWKPGAYNFDKYKRFKAMIDLNAIAAYLSTSYGLGQIMGFNHKAAGHSTAQQMFETAQQGEYEQLVQLVTLMKSWGMASMLSNGDFTNPNAWRNAAKKYNGGGYAKHGYHIKLARAYVKHISSLSKDGVILKVSSVLKFGAKSEAVRNLQTDLQALGYKFEFGIDGRFGREMERHVKSFQNMNDLTVDGFAGEKTLAKISEAVQQLKVDKTPEPPVFDKKADWVSLIIAIVQGIFK